MVSAALAACGVIGNQDLLGDIDSPSVSRYGCRSTAGEYSLAKSLVEITVRENRLPSHKAKGDPLSTQLDPLRPITSKDKPFTYCLDFLNSFTSVDSLKVDKDANGLLEKVEVNTDDQLDEAIVKVAEAIATISERADVRTDDELEQQIVFTDFFDPMSASDLELLNDRLSDFGLCVLVRVHGRSSASLERSVKRQCGRRVTSKVRTRLIHNNPEDQHAFKELPENFKNSLLYRPTVTADIHIMHQPNRLVKGVWLPFEKRVMTLIDSETIIGFDIKRAIFTKRATNLTFSNGVLTDVFIDKGSELAEFVKVPVSIARALTQLPTEIVRLRLGEANATADLINAQTQLIAAERALQQQRKATIDAQKNLNQQNNAQDPDTLSRCMADCRAFGNTEEACNNSCQQ